MSAPYFEFDVQKQIAELNRHYEETTKFIAEQRKLIAESMKLEAERRKMDRDRSLAPWQVVVSAMAAGGGLVAATVALMKVLG